MNLITNANDALRSAWRLIVTLAVALAVISSGGCKDNGESAAAAPAAPHAVPAISNRIDVPQMVRQNLGITFAKVERRPVTAILRVPGQFELLPSARREYRTVLPTRVELLVKQYDPIVAGQVLARLDSPEWRRVQHEAVEAEGEIKTAEAGVAVAEAAAAENERAVVLLRQRTAALAEANAPRAELTAELSLAASKSARLAAEVRAAKVKVTEAHEHYASRLRVLAAVVNLPIDQLTQPASGTTQAATQESAEPLWRTINAIEVRAAATGVVQLITVTNGGWAEAGGLIMTIADPAQVRFRAAAMQADLGRLKPGAAAMIVPPQSVRSSPADGIPATLSLGLEANPDTRTVELILTPQQAAPWARTGVSAFAEIVTGGSSQEQLAIPVAAVVQDDLTKVFFRRDPANLDKVIRVEADLGASDGRWVIVQSGVKAGDEVVVDGVYELMLTGSGNAGGGDGHFHADGTWHPAGTPEPGEK